MTLKELKGKKNIKAMISIKIGKYRSMIGYLCRVTTCITPGGSKMVIPIVSYDRNKANTSGDIPKIYTSYEDLKKDFDKVRKFNPKIIDYKEKSHGKVYR